MSEVRFVADKKGQMKRVYFDRDVLDVERVTGIQRELQRTIPLAPSNPNDLHITLLHIGKPQTLLKEIQLVNPNLTQEELLHQLGGFLLLVRHVPRGNPIDLRSKGLDIYGDQENPVLVIGLEKTEEYRESRRPLVDSLKETLFRCGIQTPDQFMEGNPNLKYALDENHNPHITLGKTSSSTILPKFSPLLFRLSQPVLANVKILDP